MKLGDTAVMFELFRKEVEHLTPEALLDKKLDFDVPIKPDDGGRDLRLLQGTWLEAALVQAYGVGGWQEPLEARRAARSTIKLDLSGPF